MDPLPEKCSDRKQEGPNRSRGLMSSAFGGFGFVCVTEDQWYNTYYIAVLIVESDFLSPEPQNNYFTPYAQIIDHPLPHPTQVTNPLKSWIKLNTICNLHF